MKNILLGAFILTAAASARAENLTLDKSLLTEAARMLPAANNSGGGGTSSGGGNFGIGLQVGTPTALTLKFGMGGNTNLVLGLGAGFAYDSRGVARTIDLSLHGDYLFTIASLVSTDVMHLTAYLGPGLWVTIGGPGYGYYFDSFYSGGLDYLGIGVRMPLGLNMRFTAAPIEAYLELDPALFVFSRPTIFVGASLGFRWFF